MNDLCMIKKIPNLICISLAPVVVRDQSLFIAWAGSEDFVCQDKIYLIPPGSNIHMIPLLPPLIGI